MKREKRLTRKDRKRLAAPTGAGAPRPAASKSHHGHGHGHGGAHIHCIACGKHLDPEVFGEPSGADFLRCDHGTDHPHCVACVEEARELVAEHDARNEPVRAAARWH